MPNEGAGADEQQK